MGEREELAATRFPSSMVWRNRADGGSPRGGIQRIVRKRMKTLKLRAFLRACIDVLLDLAKASDPTRVFSVRVTNKGLILDAAC